MTDTVISTERYNELLKKEGIYDKAVAIFEKAFPYDEENDVEIETGEDLLSVGEKLPYLFGFTV